MILLTSAIIHEFNDLYPLIGPPKMEKGASGQFSDWIVNLGDHIHDERLKVVFSQVRLQRRPGLDGV